MSSVMPSIACSFFDIKNIEESRLPSKTGTIRFLAVSALVASVFASALIPAVICTGVIAATTAAIMLKNRQIERLNESDIVNLFNNKINNCSVKEKNNLLAICFGCLTNKTKELSESDRKHFSGEMQKYLKKEKNELVQEKSKNGISIRATEDQKKIEQLSIVSTLNVIEHLYTQLEKPHKVKEITNFIKQMQPDTEISINQA